MLTHHSNSISLILTAVISVLSVLVVIAVFFTLQSDQKELEQQVAELRGDLGTTTAILADTKRTLDTIVENNQDLQDQLAQAREEQQSAEERLEQTTVHVSNLETELEGKVGEQALSSLIQTWEPRVTRIRCAFRDSDGDRAQGNASAMAVFRGGSLQFLTNKHVVEHEDHSLEGCEIRAGMTGSTLEIQPDAVDLSSDRDIAFLVPSEQPSELLSASLEVTLCREEPSTGSRVLILGYPRTGAEDTITATEGIISGSEDGYYVTSAKIEQGNSGGAAVSVGDNCLLGMPTLSVAGRLESLARILPVTSL